MGVSYLKVNQEVKKFQEQLSKLPGSSKGVLYIGMTEGPLLKRVCDLQKALITNSNLEQECPKSSGHAQMGKKYYRIRKKFNIDDLYIQIFPGENPKQAETEALENYVQGFAELPPLNGSYGFFDPEWSIF